MFSLNNTNITCNTSTTTTTTTKIATLCTYIHLSLVDGLFAFAFEDCFLNR